MLGHLDTHHGQVEHLPRLVAIGRHFSQRSLTMDTLPHTMHLDVIWMLYCLQRVPFVPRLSTRLLAAGLTLALRSWLLEPVAGWWLATVTAVLRLLVFQRLDPDLELVNELLLLLENSEKGVDQLRNQRDHAFFALQVSGVYLIPSRQLQSNPVAIVPGLYDFGKLKNTQVWLSSYLSTNNMRDCIT